MKGYRFNDFLGKRVMIVGEVRSGKTRLTGKLLDEAVQRLSPHSITAIDMAPTPKASLIRAGGRLDRFSKRLSEVRYLKPKYVYAPRLQGETGEEVRRYARKNRSAIDPLIEEFISKPTPILFINDLTLYLHAGDSKRIIEAISKCGTVVLNAYRGDLLKDDKASGISRRESEALEEVMGVMDLVVEMSTLGSWEVHR